MTRSKLFVATILIGVLALSLANVATAAKKPKGVDLYKEYCKGCHEADSPHGEYTPMSLIQDQWTRFFDKKYVRTHKDVIDVEKQYLDGAITNGERYNKVISIWSAVTEKVADAMFDEMEEQDRIGEEVNPI